MQTTTKNPTDNEIRALRREAAESGDIAQVHICDVALGSESPITTPEAFAARYGGRGLDRLERAEILACRSREQALAECADAIQNAVDPSPGPQSDGARGRRKDDPMTTTTDAYEEIENMANIMSVGDDGEMTLTVASPASAEEADEVIAELREILPGWSVDWTGCSNTDDQGETTDDILAKPPE